MRSVRRRERTTFRMPGLQGASSSCPDEAYAKRKRSSGMKPLSPRALAAPIWWVALTLNLTAWVIGTAWLLRSDFLFGHFTGPPALLIGALVLAGLALAGSVGWVIAQAVQRSRAPLPHPQAGIIWRAVILFASCLPTVLGSLIGISELPKARAELRRQRVQAAEKQGPASVPILIAALDDQEWTIRQEAASGLWEIGPDAAPAVPALSRKQRARVQANDSVDYATALERISPAAAKTLLEEILNSGTSRERLAAASDFWTWKNQPSLLSPHLIPLLSDADPEIRTGAAELLEKIGSPARSALPALRKAELDPDGAVRVEAASAYGKIANDPAGAAHLLARAVASSDPNTPYRAARKLHELGPAARVAVPDLIAVLKGNKSATSRGAAAEALGEIKPATKATLASLHAAEQDKDASVRSIAKNAIRALQQPLSGH